MAELIVNSNIARDKCTAIGLFCIQTNSHRLALLFFSSFLSMLMFCLRMKKVERENVYAKSEVEFSRFM